MLTSLTWPEGRGGGSGEDGQGEVSKVAFGSQAWVAERIAEAREAAMVTLAADALSAGAAGAGGVRARWAACRPRPERGEGLGCGRAQRRGEVAGVGAARVVGEEERGMMVGSTSASVLDQGKGVNK